MDVFRFSRSGIVKATFAWGYSNGLFDGGQRPRRKLAKCTF
jgi:hypothetical protein